jgi:hypothetical protein
MESEGGCMKKATIFAVGVLTFAPYVLAKPKRAVPRETVMLTSPCANIWQPILKLIDGEYPITFIYDPWYRVTFLKASGSTKAVQSVFGGSLPPATIQLRSDPAAPTGTDFCLAETFSDESLAPEVARLIAALPGATIVPQKPQRDGKQK